MFRLPNIISLSSNVVRNRIWQGSLAVRHPRYLSKQVTIDDYTKGKLDPKPNLKDCEEEERVLKPVSNPCQEEIIPISAKNECVVEPDPPCQEIKIKPTPQEECPVESNPSKEECPARPSPPCELPQVVCPPKCPPILRPIKPTIQKVQCPPVQEPIKPVSHNQECPAIPKFEYCPKVETKPEEPIKCPADGHGQGSEPPKKNWSLWIAGILVAGGAAGFIYYNNSRKKGSDGVLGASQQDVQIIKPFRSPESSADIPKHVPYLLIGGGTASFAAFRAIKSQEAKAKILVITDEAEMPYMRPPLSKEVWFEPSLAAESKRFKQWNGVERSLFYEPSDFYLSTDKLVESKNGGVSIIRGYSVVNINVENQLVTLDDGTEINYDKCLLATGVRPRSLDVFKRTPAKIKDKISLYKSVQNFEELKKRADKSQAIAIVGGGFLGSELACALAYFGRNKDLKVYQLFNEKGNMGKVLPQYLSMWTTDRVKEQGVDVLTNCQITDVEAVNGDQVKLILSDGRTVVVDEVVQAVGTEPNTELAKTALLELDPNLGGFVVNAELKARTNLYVAGDVSCFYDPKLGRRRVEHHDHAVVSGRLAGENMAGGKKIYTHQSMFWSDLGPKIGYEAIGIIDSSLPTVAFFGKQTEQDKIRSSDEESNKSKESSRNTVQAASVEPEKVKEPEPSTRKDNEEEDYSKGVVFYLRDGLIVGILLWNVFNRMNVARRVLQMDTKFDDLNEVAKLFDIYEQQN